ncbi:MAG TPA: UMP kinase [Bacteroidales bacterium]|nr:UMP kinase [Bacteroidales bacterium]MDI9532669.1 UMP kinase [Bacteroidota bacterium]OPZ57311.1 MAG: Uridylate kinase [Bacteroidetes bacterium ADurb.BinA012]MBK7731752.1 UMP kinase [Bacteroidales bacterium]MBP7036052.1 UMP kinase [Bacteroidales bacterium]
MKYKRILLKLSGESAGGPDGTGLDAAVLSGYARQIKDVVDAGCQVAIVIGGGNIFRGLGSIGEGYDRVKGDQMGMLATVINSLALESFLSRADCNVKVFTSIRMEPVGELYSRDRASAALDCGCVTILAGGTGNPFFTTDTAAALRAVELNCDVLLKGTRVDGVYTADPEKDPSAVKYDSLTFGEAIEKKLRVMDQTAFSMCAENGMPLIVFNMNREGNLMAVAKGNRCGTVINL